MTGEVTVDFPFFFARISRFYHMTYQEVMEMPISGFWMYAKQMDRIRAEEELRAIKVGAAASSPEFAKHYGQQLTEDLGEFVTAPKPEIDHAAGVAKLKRLANATAF